MLALGFSLALIGAGLALFVWCVAVLVKENTRPPKRKRRSNNR